MTLLELIFALLEVRGVAVDPDSEARVRRCQDLETLERLARRAREVETAAELVAEI
ncbi:hypothetical protein [Enhygromyxa salina]|uniref:hypothetical protein n=1 Tax=Enhygromyxa salina TaxID=215803 RepID=UPI0015E781A6|nr:hypothetical protein [Enhygromyxa salina]